MTAPYQRRPTAIEVAHTRARHTFVVGVDPGVSTGLAIVRGDGFRAHVEQGPHHVMFNDFTTRFPFLTYRGNDVLIACERFVVTDQTARRSAQPIPLQVIGVVTQLALINDWFLRMQSPSDVKTLIDNALLTKLNLKVKPRDVEQHDANDANDAMRHALALMAYRRSSMFDRLLIASGV